MTATMLVPTPWRVTDEVRWNAAQWMTPVRASARAESADGTAWIEALPQDVFYRYEADSVNDTAPGRPLHGMLFRQHVGIDDALQVAVRQHRGQYGDLQIVGREPIDPASLATAFGQPAPTGGDAAVLRVRYSGSGRRVEEDFFGMLAEPARMNFPGQPGPMLIRPVTYLHALGATDGTLQAVYPLLAWVATSIRTDSVWTQTANAIRLDLYRSQQEPWGNRPTDPDVRRRLRRWGAAPDLPTPLLEHPKKIRAQRDAALRAANARAATDTFSRFLADPARAGRPYWAGQGQPLMRASHWVDQAGNYRGSDDPSFDPGKGTASGWTRLRIER